MSTRQLRPQCELLLVAAAPAKEQVRCTNHTVTSVEHAATPPSNAHAGSSSVLRTLVYHGHDHLLLEKLLVVHGVRLGPLRLSITPCANGEAWVSSRSSSRSKFASPTHSAQSKSITDHDLVDSGSVKPELLQGLWGVRE